MELLKKLYEIHAKSGQEKRIKRFIRKYVHNNFPDVEMSTDKVGNIYFIKGVADTYPVVVAHLDQVQNDHSRDFQALEVGGIIMGYSQKSRKQQGLGADDKNGIWVALKCLERFDCIKVALFVSEEIGCVGSEAADMGFFLNARFVLQCDRKGAHDLITEAGWAELCSKEFVVAIQPNLYGYKEEQGMLTDVLALKENGLSVSCVNISCGYYEPHTDHEITNINDLMNCLLFVEHIIENCTDVYPHEMSYSSYSYNGYRYSDYGTSEKVEQKSFYNEEREHKTFQELYYDVIKELVEEYPQVKFDEVLWYLKESYPGTFFWEDWTRSLFNKVLWDVVLKHQSEREHEVEFEDI